MIITIKEISSQIKRTLDFFGLTVQSFLFPSFLGTIGVVLRLAVFGLFIPLIHLLFSDGDASRLGKFAFLLRGFTYGHPTLVFLMLLTAVALLRGVAVFWSRVLINRNVIRVNLALESALIQRFLLFGKYYYDRSGYLKNAKKVEKLPKKASKGVLLLFKFIVSTASILLYTMVLLIISWPMAMVAVGFLGVYFLAIQRLSAGERSLEVQAEEEEEKANQTAYHLLLNMNVIRLSNMTMNEFKKWNAYLKSKETIRAKAMQSHELLNPLHDLTGILMLVLFAWFGSLLVTSSSIFEISQFIIFFLILRQSVSVVSNLLQIPDQWNAVQRNLDKIRKLMSNQGKYIVEDGNRSIPELTSQIRIRNLSFKYGRGQKILDNVECSFYKGKLNFLCGSTGSGKSTLLQLILRFYDCRPSSIFWDNTDIREFQMQSLYWRIAYAGADPILFNKSIRYNLTYGIDGISEDDLINAVTDAQALDFIMRFKHNFDEVIGENGIQLSTGERQRIGLARLFLSNADVILIDEATSALDVATEHKIYQFIRSRFSSKLIINITHNLNLIQADDHVVLLENGKVIEENSCSSLLNDQQLFYRLRGISGLLDTVDKQI